MQDGSRIEHKIAPAWKKNKSCGHFVRSASTSLADLDDNSGCSNPYKTQQTCICARSGVMRLQNFWVTEPVVVLYIMNGVGVRELASLRSIVMLVWRASQAKSRPALSMLGLAVGAKLRQSQRRSSLQSRRPLPNQQPPLQRGNPLQLPKWSIWNKPKPSLQLLLQR